MPFTPTFADPRSDFVFHRIFGSDDHRQALLGFLNDVLGLDEAHRITEVRLLPPEQRPKVAELKYSIVDVKCIDATGVNYVVEMQVLHVEAFDKRVVYNVAKAYANQIGAGAHYPRLNDVIGISICDFEMWPRKKGYNVPMLSRWRMQEQTSGTLGLNQLQFIFLELPKYAAGDAPQSPIDKWAYFFRESSNLQAIPAALQQAALVDAFEGARTARFSREEWDVYLATDMAIEDERGRFSFAYKEGKSDGKSEGKSEGLREGELVGKRKTLLRQMTRAGLLLTPEEQAQIEACLEVATLERWLDNILGARSVADVLG